MGCSYAIQNLADHYLVVDSDVVFIKKTRFFNSGRMLLTKGVDFHKPCLDCCEKLLGMPANEKYSFVAHHMLIRKSIMVELLDYLGKKFRKTWYDAVLDNINYREISPFSEYETYGYYLKKNYPKEFEGRELTNSQRFKMRDILKILLNQVDYVTFHSYKKPERDPKTNPRIYRLVLNMVRNKLQK